MEKIRFLSRFPAQINRESGLLVEKKKYDFCGFGPYPTDDQKPDQARVGINSRKEENTGFEIFAFFCMIKFHPDPEQFRFGAMFLLK